jgi:FG-GAP-like repeat/IPT/TIG domain/FG-GAP repeat
MNENLYLNFANISTSKSQNNNLFQVFYKKYSSLAQILGFWALLFLSTSIVAQRPTISSFSPSSGTIGTSVTITGTNFNTTAVQNIVYFGATKATVTAASATSLTVTVPTGATYQPITVLNTVNGLSGSSAVPFNVAFRGSINATSFDPKDDFTTGTNPYSVSIGDLDGDGKPDLAVANFGSNTVSIYRNTSSIGSITASSFASKVDFTTGTGPTSVSIGDLDGDGKPDLVVANSTNNTISIFRNTASVGSITTGSFASKVDFTTGLFPFSVSIGDLDGDGKPDLAVANADPNNNLISIFRNTASAGSITTSSFDNKVDYAAGTSPQSISIGDLDGDGKSDLAVANRAGNTVSILRNTASVGSFTASSFASKVDFATGTSPRSVSIGDLDGDGKPDLAVANNVSNTVSIYRNTASMGSITTSSFASRVNFTTGTNPISVSMGDLDGDGKPDLAVANYNSATVSIFRNTTSVGSITTSSFASKLDFTTGTNPYSVSIGDLDGDSKPDLAVANSGSTTVSILRNNPLLPPAINSFSPSSGAIGSSVVITGTEFNIAMSQNIVYFGATRATVTAASATSLTVTVPTGATYQPISVLNVASGLSGSSTKPFNVTFRGSINASSFDPKIDFTTGSNPYVASIGDLDGDGKPDLTVPDFSNNTISIYHNTASVGNITASSFDSKVDFATVTGSVPYAVSIGDLDGDGKPDLVVANSNGNTISIFRNTASVGSITASSFASKVDFTTGTSPYSVSIGDLDGDGKPDLAVANYGSNTVSIFRNTSSVGSITVSSFASKVDFTTGTGSISVSIGDLDGDGKPDLAVANYNATTVSIFRNTTSVGSITASSFANKVDFTTGRSPNSVSIGDLDGDGKPDLAVANYNATTVSIFRNTASVGSITTSSFDSKLDFTTGTYPYSVSIGDLDGDGKPDLAVANNGSNTISIFRNTASAGSITTNSFANKVDFTTKTGSYSVSIGDLDGDGKPDLAVANSGDATVSILRNNPALPTINSFSPSSGEIGSSVVITGKGFNTSTAQNIVYFGATRATVTAASATSLTVTVPMGATYQPITVLNTATNWVGSSAKPFNVTFRGLINATSFDPKDDFTTGLGSSPRSVRMGDLDGDGKSDLVVVNSGNNTVSVYRNISTTGSIGSGSFATKVDFATGADPFSVSIGDLDGDGKPDLAVVNNGSNTVSIYRNTTSVGSITASSFDSKVDFTTGTNPYFVSIGDLDGDGKPDLAVANINDNTVSVFQNTASVGSITTNSFASKVDFTTGTSPFSVSIGDLNGDNKPDLVVVSNSSNTVSIYRNTASIGSITTGSFANKVDFTTGTGPRSVSIGDLDGDGKPDLAVTNFSSNTVSIFRNTASVGSITTGSFANKVDFTTGTNPRSVGISDLDGDGKPDLAVANNGSATVSILRNTTSAGSITASSFVNRVDFMTGTNSISVSIGDLDSDGKPDLAVANFNSGTVSVLRNNPALLLTTINSFSPSSGEIGSSVVITGTGFNTTAAQNLVFFGATMATVTAASATSLTVTVPTGATYQPISVLNIANGLSGFSTKPFIVTFEGIINPTFLNPKVDFTTGASPFSVSIGDLDGDGKPDLAVANNGSATVSIFRNTSSVGSIAASSFANKVDFTTGTRPISVSIGDLDGDGKPDLVVSNVTSNTVSIFRNTASVGSITASSFASKVDFAIGGDSSPRSVNISDLDRDGKPDLVVVNANTNTVSIFRNIASVGSITTSSFANKVDFTTGTSPTSVSISDLDGDGKPDLAVVNNVSNTVSIFRNTALAGSITTGSFANKVDFTTGTNPYSVSIGDLDGDEKPDLAVANDNSNTVSIFRNTALVGSITASSLANKVDFTTGIRPTSVSIGDLDGDGKPDLAVANFGSNTVSIFRNTASVGSITTNSFDSKLDFTTGANPLLVSIGDLDGDGKPDLTMANFGSNTVSILRQISTASSIVSGNWENTTTWKNGLIPQIGDLVVINPNHTVTLNSVRDAKYLRFKLNAQLQYGNTTAQLKVGF